MGKYLEIMETMRDFILGGSKTTADGDCSHEIKRRLLLGRPREMLWGGKWEGGSCLGMHVRIKDFKI